MQSSRPPSLGKCEMPLSVLGRGCLQILNHMGISGERDTTSPSELPMLAAQLQPLPDDKRLTRIKDRFCSSLESHGGVFHSQAYRTLLSLPDKEAGRVPHCSLGIHKAPAVLS